MMMIKQTHQVQKLSIKTHNSESRDQEEAGCMQRTSELFNM